MATKSLDERLEELYNRHDNVGQQFNADDIKTFVEGIRDAREKGGTPIKGATATELQPDETPTAELTPEKVLVLGIPKGAKGDDGKKGETGAEGKSAYQVWLDANGFSEAEHPVIEYINSLKSHVSGFVPVAYNSTAAGKIIGQTFDFALENPVDGSMVIMPNAEPSATGSIMFAVSVIDGVATYTRVGDVNIDTSSFAQSSDIVNNLNDGGIAKMLSAEQGKVLNDKHYMTLDTVDLTTDRLTGYINNDTKKWVKPSTSTNTYYRKLCRVPNGATSVNVVCNDTEGTVVGFIYSVGSLDSTNGAIVKFADGWTGTIPLNAGKSYRFNVPTVTLSEPSNDLRVFLYVALGKDTDSYPRTPQSVTWERDLKTVTEDIIEHNLTVDEQIANNISSINNIEEWRTIKNIDIPLPTSKHPGWLSYNGDNWYWNAQTSPIKERAEFVVISIGNDGVIGSDVSKVILKANNETVGYIRHRSTTASDLLTVGTAYTFLTEIVTFPTTGNKIQCTAGTFCEGYNPGDGYDAANRPFKIIASGSEKEVTIPEDAAYLVILTSKCANNSTSATNNPAVDCGTQVVNQKIIQDTRTLHDILGEIGSETGMGTTIFDFNPIKDVAHKVHQARRQSGYELATANRAPLWGYAFMHVSDCHGGSTKDDSKEQWGKLMEYAKALRDNSLIDDVVDTGDVIEARFSQFNGNSGRTISDWRTDENDETKKVLTVIGNHDTRGPSSTDTQGNWRDNIGKNVYDVLMADIDEWNVEQPDNADTDGKCYYYKDYTRTANGTTYTLRALFLDMMGWGYKRVNGEEVSDNSQREWVWGVLEEARESNMMVVVFCHEIPAEFTSIRSSMSSKYASKLNSGGTNLSSYNPKFKELAYLIHYHMVLGGRFAGYICGHSHTTFIGKISGSVSVGSDVQTLVNTGLVTEVADSTTVNFDTWGDYYPQRACVVDTTQVGLYRQNTVVTMHDGVRIKDTDSEHSFWIVNISTGGVISLIKIGFHLNKYYQKRDVLRMVGRVYGYFSASTEYSAGSIVSYADNKYYRITSKHSANVTWENTSKEDYPFIFDGNFEYAAGNIVSKDGNLWRFLSPAVSNGTTDWVTSDKEPYSRVISE